MRNDHYPKGTVQTLLQTVMVADKTKQVLQSRLVKNPVEIPMFFDADSFAALGAVCGRLIPQPDPDRLVDLADGLDTILAEGKGNGWRYDAMPGDRDSFTLGLNGINEESVTKYGRSFYLLQANEQDEILNSIQSGEVNGATWKTLPAKLFFEELLAAVVEIYYSHPFAKDEIGEVAFADAKGWQKIGLNELETHEPQPLQKNSYASH